MLNTKKMVRTNVMLDKELIESIDEFADDMAEDRSTAIRQLLKKALLEEKIGLAINKFQQGISLREAAEIAGIDYWDFQMELDKRGIPMISSISVAKKRMPAK